MFGKKEKPSITFNPKEEEKSRRNFGPMGA